MNLIQRLKLEKRQRVLRQVKEYVIVGVQGAVIVAIGYVFFIGLKVVFN